MTYSLDLTKGMKTILDRNFSMILVRHAPSTPAGFLYGRTDPAADVSQVAVAHELLGAIKSFNCDLLICSPALRCRMTAHKLFEVTGQALSLNMDERLWEQNFGAWEGLAYSDIPDIGERSLQELANYKDHGGECFREVCERAWSCFEQLEASHPKKRLCIVAHAGILRAASVFKTTRSVTEALTGNPAPLDFVYI